MGILVLEARISDNYFLGKDKNDTFYIFKSKGKSETVTKANLNVDKEKMLHFPMADRAAHLPYTYMKRMTRRARGK